MRSAAIFLVLAIDLAGGPVVRCPLRADELDGAATSVSLEDRLKAGLKARRPEEDEFLEQVADLVTTGRLPRKLVDSTYMWAIRRRQEYPFPAFERALRLQAERLGVEF
jgi:hypothetical protein